MKPSQHGFEGIVSEPTLFLAGEAGREEVSIRPSSGGGSKARGGGDTFIFNASFPNVMDKDNPQEIQRKLEPFLKWFLHEMQARR